MATKITHQQKQTILVLVSITLVMVVSWIAFGVYFSFSNVNLPPEASRNLRPITPVIDRATLESLSNRTAFTEEQLSFFPLSQKSDGSQFDPESTTPQPAQPATPAEDLDEDLDDELPVTETQPPDDDQDNLESEES